jgi:hypothetical protein
MSSQTILGRGKERDRETELLAAYRLGVSYCQYVDTHSSAARMSGEGITGVIAAGSLCSRRWWHCGQWKTLGSVFCGYSIYVLRLCRLMIGECGDWPGMVDVGRRRRRSEEEEEQETRICAVMLKSMQSLCLNYSSRVRLRSTSATPLFISDTRLDGLLSKFPPAWQLCLQIRCPLSPFPPSNPVQSSPD